MTPRRRTLRALLVDDEAPARAELRYLLEAAGGVDVVGEAASAAEALQLIEALDYDVVFLDIRMPAMSGVQLAEALATREDRPAVVFVTAYGAHAVKAFEVAAADYLVKPVQAQRLKQTIDRLAAVAGRVDQGAIPRRQDGHVATDTVPVRKHGHTLLVPAGDILYATAYDNYAYLHTGAGRYLCTTSLGGLEEKLAPRRFLRVHRRYLVNLSHVTRVSPDYGGGLLLTLDDEDETCIPVSRRRAPKVRKALGL